MTARNKMTAVEYIEKGAAGNYQTYKYRITLSGGQEIDYTCVAQNSSEAWLLAAKNCAHYNYPCVSIELSRDNPTPY